MKCVPRSVLKSLGLLTIRYQANFKETLWKELEHM